MASPVPPVPPVPPGPDGADDVSSERMMVLRLLEQGKITAGEAADLLRALTERPDWPPRPGWAGPPGWRGREGPVDPEAAARRARERVERFAERGRRHAEFWARHADEIAARAAEHATRAAEQVGENVSRMLSNLPDVVERVARTGWGAWGPGYRFEDEVEGDLEGEGGPAGLDLEGWNGSVALHGASGGRVRLVLRKTVHAASEDEARAIAERVTASVFGRQVTVHRADSTEAWPGGVSLEAFLPRDAVWGGVVRTGNGHLTVDGLSLRGLRLESNNGRVDLEGCSGEDVSVVTSNARIEARGLRGKIDLRTSNGAIVLGLAAGNAQSEVQAVTSNGPIDVELAAGVAVDVDATTSNGRIDAAGLGPEAPASRGSGRADLHWRSPEWDVSAARARLSLRTSNGSVRFR